MAPARRNALEPLARVNFPLYSIQMITERHVLVGGGGGSPNSGVKNGFEIFEVSNDGNKFVSEHAIRHLTGPSAIMNCSTFNNGKHIYLVAGQEGHCQLYNIVTEVVDSDADTTSKCDSKDSKEASTKNVRRRNKSSNGISPVDGKQNEPQTQRRSKKNTDDNVNCHKRISFKVKPNDCIQTDFSPVEPVQKVVRISPGLGKLMVTGGNDGHLRVWNFPAMTKKFDIAAHTKEVDDLDISPDDTMAASVSRDKLALVTCLLTGKRLATLTSEGTANFIFKRCRFGIVEGDKEKPRLFTIANPIGSAGKARSVLQVWEPRGATLLKTTYFDEALSALAVSPDGRFVAVGTMTSGHVSLHVAFSLRRVLHVPNAHAMFVTGLQFLPQPLSGGQPIPGQAEAAVVSVSVDNRVCLHSLNYRYSVPVWVALVLIVGSLFAVFVLCSLAGI